MWIFAGGKIGERLGIRAKAPFGWRSSDPSHKCDGLKDIALIG
jgi:hypothetical protein